MKLSDKDSQQWYMVGAIITGAGMGTDTVGAWLTTIDPSSSTPSGIIYSANGMAKEFSDFPQPQTIRFVYISSHPDIQNVMKCYE